MSQKLKNKIQNKTARIGVVGLGYVGLPLAVEFAKSGLNVTGIDINENRVKQLNKGINYIQDVSNKDFADVITNKKFNATTDFSVLKQLDVILVCVPTPLNKLKDPDVSYILNVLEQLEKYVHKDMLISLESTTYPGTTRELLLPELEKSGLKVGEDLFLCFSPERVDPGNPTYKINNTPKVIGGITKQCTEVGKILYKQIIEKVVPVSSPEAAEMVKILENTFRSINIGLANEIAIMCEKLGIDVWEIIDAASTKPFGFMKFTPGPGLGGHCIPIDPHYLSWKMKTLNYDALFIELAGKINTQMPLHVVSLITKGLNASQKSINNSRILLLGMAYKNDIDDVRESPALDVLALLEQNNAMVEYFDQYVSNIKWNDDKKFSLKKINEEIIKDFDVVVILTDHSNIDYDLVLANAKLVVDTRNVYPGITNDNLIRLGSG